MLDRKIDPIVEQNVDLLRSRSSVGIAKYGKTLEQNVHDNYFQHLIEELADGMNYIQAFKNQMNVLCNTYGDEELGRRIKEIYRTGKQ